jgi:hypothetical protein
MQLLDHLSLPRKFLLLGLLGCVLIAVPTSLYLSAQLEMQSSSELEAAGTPLVRGLLKTIRLTQRPPPKPSSPPWMRWCLRARRAG